MSINATTEVDLLGQCASETLGALSRIVTTRTPGSVVTTLKNIVGHVVTEFGVTELRGRAVHERAAALIGLAAPQHREQLTREARVLGYL